MNSFYFSSNTPQATAKISPSIMNNYSTLFQSSSSSSTATLPQNSHLSLLNMLMNPHAKNHEPGREDHSLNHVHTSLAETSFEGSSQVMENEGSPDKKKNEKRPRKPRFAFQTRSLVDMLDDGYRWRKYGQKAVKNNKFPRSYFRCTHQGCSVKKQVQRLSKDEGIVVTTYEGMHSHTIQKSTDNFEHILSQMQIYTSY